MLFIVFNGTAAQFHVGFYVGRVYSLFTSLIVLVALLAETLRLNARLVHYLLIERERSSKLMNMAAMMGSISHKVRKPLMTIAMNGGAALRYLAHRQPNLEEAVSALDRLLAETDRARQILDGINGPLKGGEQGINTVDLNELIHEVLWIQREELSAREIATETQLVSEHSSVTGHRRQLQEVILNLAQNAIEAMGATERGRRRLCLATKRIGDEVFLTVEDSGPGIDPDYSTRLFDAFVTSKPGGHGAGIVHLPHDYRPPRWSDFGPFQKRRRRPVPMQPSYTARCASGSVAWPIVYIMLAQRARAPMRLLVVDGNGAVCVWIVLGRFAPIEHSVVPDHADAPVPGFVRNREIALEALCGRRIAPGHQQHEIAGRQDGLENVPIEQPIGPRIKPDIFRAIGGVRSLHPLCRTR